MDKYDYALNSKENGGKRLDDFFPLDSIDQPSNVPKKPAKQKKTSDVHTAERVLSRCFSGDQYLIDSYKTGWKGTQASFCRQFNINRGNFNQWLQGKKSSPASKKAVLEWIDSNY